MSRHHRRLRLSAHRSGLTLIEMLVATAITLLMMAAVVNLFANLTGSIRNRRAVIELSGQLRQARQRLSLDLAGATCPAATWQRHGDDVGYLEIIEGRYSDANPSVLLTDVDGDTVPDGIDVTTSIIPSSQLIDAEAGQRTDGRSLGDYDDVLALTVRSDDEKFAAQVGGNRVESRLAEVVWFAVENPANGLLGEPGLRTIYRRALIIAPTLPPIPGPPDSAWFFQRYDVSAHYDPNVSGGAWVPNTLGDLTRRENRCYRQSGQGPVSPHPHMMATGGAMYNNDAQVAFTRTSLDTQNADARATGIVENGSVVRFVVTNGGAYDDLPSARVAGPNLEATARPVLAQVSKAPNARWEVAQITFGPAPLSIHRVPSSGGGSFIVDRTGEDLMLSDALAFDLRVFDPGAPVYTRAVADSASAARVLVQPGDPGFVMGNVPVSYGAYVDMGWSPHYPDQLDRALPSVGPLMPVPLFDIPRQAGYHPRLDIPTVDHTIYPFGWPAEYDTWSLHYESDGIDQDGLLGVDQGTNGLDDDGANGPDDVAERETAPPYDTALRGLQVRLRVYERDARQIRETSVTRSLVP